jgi:hypothetical protein
VWKLQSLLYSFFLHSGQILDYLQPPQLKQDKKRKKSFAISSVRVYFSFIYFYLTIQVKLYQHIGKKQARITEVDNPKVKAAIRENEEVRDAFRLQLSQSLNYFPSGILLPIPLSPYILFPSHFLFLVPLSFTYLSFIFESGDPRKRCVAQRLSHLSKS